MEPTPHPLTLTVEQAVKILGIGRSTAYELVHTGAIPSLRLGRRIVVPTAKLAEQLGIASTEFGLTATPTPAAAPWPRTSSASPDRTSDVRSEVPSILF